MEAVVITVLRIRLCVVLAALGNDEVHVGVHVEADDHLVERFGQTARLKVVAKKSLN